MVTVFQNWMYTRLAAAFVMGNTEVARAMHLTWGNNRSNTKYIEELKTFAKLACLLKWNSQLKTVFPGVCAPSSFEPVQMLTYFLQLNYIFECWNLEKKKRFIEDIYQIPGTRWGCQVSAWCDHKALSMQKSFWETASYTISGPKPDI